MRSVADELRERTRREVMSMSASERVELALRLGEEDLELFCRTHGLSREDARRRLRARRQRGRTPSMASRR